MTVFMRTFVKMMSQAMNVSNSEYHSSLGVKLGMWLSTWAIPFKTASHQIICLIILLNWGFGIVTRSIENIVIYGENGEGYF